MQNFQLSISKIMLISKKIVTLDVNIDIVYPSVTIDHFVKYF